MAALTRPTRTVLVADDHPPTRLGIRLTLEENGFVVCAEVATAKSALEAALAHEPDIALLDVHMPGNGIDAARAIAAALPDCAVVMLTVSRDDSDLFEAVRAGACGYLLKDIDPDRLPLALEGVLVGEAALPRSLVARLMSEFHSREAGFVPAPRRGALAKLTSREWEVLEQMREGLTTQEIADRLFVAPVTVRGHVAAVLRKLKVESREAAVRMSRVDG